MPADHIARLAANARRRSEQTMQKAHDTLTAMAANDEAVTVAGLAKTAEISRSWIYTQPELRERIDELNQAAAPRPHRSSAASRASVESLKRRLDLAHRRIVELRDENQRLRRAVEQLHGQLRDHRQA